MMTGMVPQAAEGRARSGKLKLVTSCPLTPPTRARKTELQMSDVSDGLKDSSECVSGAVGLLCLYLLLGR